VDKYTKNLDKLIRTYKDKIIFISFAGNYGGHAVRRIISASPEVYYPDDPIRYPDNLEGFIAHDFKTTWQKDFVKQHLASCHEDFIEYPPLNFDDTLNLYKIIKKINMICIKTHDLNIHDKFQNLVVRVVGKEPDRKIRINPNNPKHVDMVYKNNVINLNINNLFSQNYDEFEAEYLNLCSKLNIFPQINSVRSFILLWLEKQKRLKKILNES
jgi:hypothetical protein